MGIPGLIATLQPFANWGALDGQNVVIDGPALAYAILYICRSNGVTQPSYQLLGRSVTQWLDKLASRVANIDAIFFDGYLPVAKRDVRMDRAAKSFAQLSQFYNSCPNGCDKRHLGFVNSTSEIDLFTTSQPNTSRQLIPPPFLVPAIIETLLKHSTYRDLVQLVPGEADAFCALRLVKHGGIVLTSDSDLLIHDLGQGRVVFFRDIRVDEGAQWSSFIYDPRQICERLGLNSPGYQTCRIGYEVYRNPHASLSQLGQNLSLPLREEKEYETFCQQYVHHELAELPITSQGRTLLLQGLDPRISELVLQLGRHDDSETVADVKMFLPILIENPIRGSAWEPCTAIRQLAYTLYRWLVPGTVSVVQEYRRVQSVGQKGRSVDVLSHGEARERARGILDIMSRMKQHVSKDHYWTLVCLALNIRECQEQEKRSHALHMIEQSDKPRPNSKMSWDLIHFAALLQASFYSFRALKQILSLAPSEAWGRLAAEAAQIHEALDSLPLLEGWPAAFESREILSKIGEANVINALREFVHINGTTDNKKASKKRKKEGKGHETPPKRSAVPSISKGGTIFSLLPDDE